MTLFIDCPECDGAGRIVRSDAARPWLGSRSVRCWICQGARRVAVPLVGERSWLASRHPYVCVDQEAVMSRG